VPGDLTTSLRAVPRHAGPFLRLWFRVVAPHPGLLASPLDILLNAYAHVLVRREMRGQVLGER
jgi:hypothetical protein